MIPTALIVQVLHLLLVIDFSFYFQELSFNDTSQGVIDYWFWVVNFLLTIIKQKNNASLGNYLCRNCTHIKKTSFLGVVTIYVSIQNHQEQPQDNRLGPK